MMGLIDLLMLEKLSDLFKEDEKENVAFVENHSVAYLNLAALKISYRSYS